MHRRTKLLAAGTALVMTTAVCGASAAAASDGGRTTAKPSPSAPAKTKVKNKTVNGVGLDVLAKRYGVSAERLGRALRNVKVLLGRNGGKVSDPAVVRGFASDLGVSRAKAQRMLKEIVGKDAGPGKPGKPAKPEAPGKPGKPGKPGAPEKPGKPGAPGKPATVEVAVR